VFAYSLGLSVGKNQSRTDEVHSFTIPIVMLTCVEGEGRRIQDHAFHPSRSWRRRKTLQARELQFRAYRFEKEKKTRLLQHPTGERGNCESPQRRINADTSFLEASRWNKTREGKFARLLPRLREKEKERLDFQTGR